MKSLSKLTDLTLVTKHFPVANYSYPRSGSDSSSAAPYSACSTASSHFFLPDRASVGSNGSAPGLIDDRTDSEDSNDDDYQYHAHGAELWDSFWQAGAVAQAKVVEQKELDPRKKYPALVPSPHRKKRSPVIGGRPTPSWPLLNAAPESGSRKTAATYSAFPKPAPPPPTRTSLPIPHGACPSTKLMGKPQRPARPDDHLLTPCIRQPVTAPAAINAQGPESPTKHRPTMSLEHRRPRASAETTRPRTATITHRPTPSWDQQRPSRSFDGSVAKPMNGNTSATTTVRVAHFATVEDISPGKPKSRAPRAYKSIPYLPSLTTTIPAAVPPVPVLEPHSVFEDDSDCEGGRESHGISFFRFHKRAESENRRPSKASADPSVPSQPRCLRKRATTAPSSPAKEQFPEQEMPVQKRQPDIFGYMLGRRSR